MKTVVRLARSRLKVLHEMQVHAADMLVMAESRYIVAQRAYTECCAEITELELWLASHSEPEHYQLERAGP